MKSSAKRAKAFTYALALLACATALHGAVAHGAAESPAAALEALERREFQSSDDPAIKEGLAAAYWCLGQRGKAIEHWKWMAQFATGTSQRLKAEELLDEARRSPKDLATELGCST
jgi:hypothetical protein